MSNKFIYHIVTSDEDLRTMFNHLYNYIDKQNVGWDLEIEEISKHNDDYCDDDVVCTYKVRDDTNEYEFRLNRYDLIAFFNNYEMTFDIPKVFGKIKRGIVRIHRT